MRVTARRGTWTRCGLSLVLSVTVACSAGTSTPAADDEARCSAGGFLAVEAFVEVPDEIAGTGYSIFAGPPEGPLERLLSEHTAANPSISPDGRRLAFDTARNYAWSSDSGPSGTDVYVMDADGSDQEKIAKGLGPDWSPDGTKLLFVRDGLWFYDLKTGENEQIVADPAWGPGYAQIEDAEWLPDGRIGWVEVRDTAKGLSTVAVCEFPPTSPRKLIERTGSIRSFDWSPVRNEYVYATSNGWIFLVRPGQEPELLHEDAYAPVWAPEGDRIRFVTGAPYGEGPRRLAEVDLASRDLTHVDLEGGFEGSNMNDADWARCA